MRLRLERALLPTGVADDVVVEIEDGRFTAVTPLGPLVEEGRQARLETTAAEVRVPGLTLPGLANTHSHAFHRALRGRTQVGGGSFWTWREQMYDLAARLDPDTLFTLARATYREMLAAGYTGVAEFHYLHHQPDGRPYADPAAMSRALIAAAADAGIRLTLLPTLYSSSGFGAPLEPGQRRFGHATAAALLELVEQLKDDDTTRIGVAAHSVRAVAPDQLAVLAEAGRLLHVHLSEQRAENDGCLAAYGVTPTRLLADAGALGPRTTVVHATHLTDEDVALLGASGTNVSICATTERDLGDGIGPARRLHAAGCPVTVGSDSQAVVDPFEELRAVEMDERLAAETRGHWTAAELLAAGTDHRALGFGDAGAIEVGRRADLVTLDTASTRTAGTGAGAETAVFAAGAADVTQVLVDGRVTFRRGDEEQGEEQVGRELADAVGRLWP
ncbi:formiminoglutamate deiminase [Nocardioides terrae]|uniref:Formiminoglutamate deiminase n=1 Tax=Nocardioides terrae TaxID=574651 RepID=A0A1I1HGA1_9ACTN|nr:formimidoylglutamate deiminase [Nocardioides terrae]SFC22871.1 formiminoglutamate deiminase [Nocardioides terrae]